MYRYLQCVEVITSKSESEQFVEESLMKGKFIYGLLSDFEIASMNILKQVVDEYSDKDNFNRNI